ncbi:MAG: hypothetical protein M0009_03890 [Deltaproteobacteria bacterium]|nr:hypothetical protein [Deltaproteobacteria bacterium]
MQTRRLNDTTTTNHKRKASKAARRVAALAWLLAGCCLLIWAPTEAKAAEHLAYLTIQNSLGDAGSYLEVSGRRCSTFDDECGKYTTGKIQPQNQYGTGIAHFTDMTLVVARKQNDKSVEFSRTPQCTARGDMFASFQSCSGVTLNQTESKKGYLKFAIVNSNCDGVFIECR